MPGELSCAICWGVPCSLSTPWKTAAEDSRRYQLAIKDQEYYVGSWNKNSKLYCRVMNLQAGFWKGLSAGRCGVLFYHLVALWDSAHGGNGLSQGREVFINSINYYQFVCHLWSPIEFPGLREAIKNSRDADFHTVGGGIKYYLLQPDHSSLVWTISSISEYTLFSLYLVLHGICTLQQSTAL